jgi:peptidoglycan/LPS O-acetylase OafA/YrhL
MSGRIDTYQRWRETRFFPGLEGLRAVAALMVVLHHTRSHWLWGWLEGWNGVTLFFVLSGFLITTLALREEETAGRLRWRAFFVRRVFRIVPVYVVSFFLYAFLMFFAGVGAAHRDSFVRAVPWYLSPFPEFPFFSRTHIVFSLAWSLGIEEKFYLLWPLVAFVLLRRRARGRIGLALALALVLQLPIAVSSSGRALAPYTAILIGCLLAFALQNRASFARLRPLGSTTGLVAALAAVALATAVTHLWNPTAAGFRVASPYYYLPYSLAAALLVCALALNASGSGLFRSRPLRFVGRVSYPLYLTHPIGLAFAAKAVHPGGLATELVYLALGLALSLALAYGIHRVVEQPLIRTGKRLAARVTPVSLPVPLPAPAVAPTTG